MHAYVRLRNCRGMAFDNDRGGLLTRRMDDESKLETPDSSGSAEFRRAQFARDGYAVVRGLVDIETCRQARRSVMDALDPLMGPAEFEADVGYPGASMTERRACRHVSVMVSTNSTGGGLG